MLYLNHSASEVTTIWRYTNVYIIIIIIIKKHYKQILALNSLIFIAAEHLANLRASRLVLVNMFQISHCQRVYFILCA